MPTVGAYKSAQEEVILWVEAISGDLKGDETFGKWLKDGRVLCKVANIIKPGELLESSKACARHHPEREHVEDALQTDGAP